MLKDIVQSLWNMVISVMDISFPIGEYKLSFMELFIYGMLVTMILKLLFNWGDKKA